MSESKRLPEVIGAAINEEAAKRAAGDGVARLLAELEVKVEVRNGIKSSEQETVDELRKRGVPWGDIAESSGHTTAQYALMAYSPKAPKAQAKKGEALPGYSRTEAASITGLHPKTIRTALMRNAGASWIVEVEPADKRSGRQRILDLDKLVAASGRSPQKSV